MTVKSVKHVNLPAEVYLGYWFEYSLLIPFLGEEVDIPVDKATLYLKKVRVEVFNNVATFEEN
jgi:hypothetical protein